MVNELPPRLSTLLAFIVFQIISFSGVLLNLKMEEILKRALFGVIFAGLVGFLVGLLLENGQQWGLFPNRNGEKNEGDKGEHGEEEKEREEFDHEEFEEISFPKVEDRENIFPTRE